MEQKDVRLKWGGKKCETDMGRKTGRNIPLVETEKGSGRKKPEKKTNKAKQNKQHKKIKNTDKTRKRHVNQRKSKQNNL